MEKLVKVDDVLFDETMYQNIPDEMRALSYVRYFSANVALFRVQLEARGWEYEDSDKLIDMLWERVIKGCMKYGVPLTREAEANAKRLKITY